MWGEFINIAALVLTLIGSYLFLLLLSNVALKSILKHLDRLIAQTDIHQVTLTEPSLSYLVEKRIFDILFSLLGLLLFLPIFLVVAIAIKLESKGPVLYKQKRIGLNGNFFWSYKFRVRVTFSPKDIADGKFLSPFDPEITRVGRILILTGLNELPGLINVLKGDMSIVGRSQILDYNIPNHIISSEERKILLTVKPGLVSLWAILSDHIQFNPQRIIELDFYYLQKRSLSFDIKVALSSLIVILGTTSKY
ncbi:MAG: sugar transferase [Deltaproteobacteria bacterium]|nr:MAG: sugar transferase [Deltaproteobacteria bacterium]